MKKLLSLFIISLIFSGCSLPESLPLSNKKQVIASFYPIEFLAEQIGGNNVQVTNMVPLGAEPHDFEPSPRDLEKVEKADIVLFLGLGMDDWLKKAVSSSQNTFVNKELSANLTLLPAGVPEEGAHEENIYDPHVWLDPLQLAAMANTAKDAFIAADPENQTKYEQNTQKLITDLENLHESFKNGLSSCKKKDLIVSHNAFQYLAKRYNLNVFSIAGISPHSEPSPKHLADLANIIKEKNIQYVFFESKVSPEMAETLASETGAKTLVFDPIESLTEETQSENYISLMQKNLQNLKIALECQ